MTDTTAHVALVSSQSADDVQLPAAPHTVVLTYMLAHFEGHEEETAALQASIAALSGEDAKRIDWLATQFKTCTVYMSGQHPWSASYKLRDLRGATFREAIDNAMPDPQAAQGVS